MTDPEGNPGTQKREDIEYWINKYFQNKSLGLLDEEKENPKKREEVEYWMIQYLKKKKKEHSDSLYEHITSLNSGKTDLSTYNKETGEIQAQIEDIDTKIGLLRKELGNVRKEEGVEYWILKHREEKKDSLTQTLYELTADYIAGKLDKQTYDQKAAETEQQLKTVSAKASLLKARMTTGENKEETKEEEQTVVTSQVTAKPVLIKQTTEQKKEKPPEPKEEKTQITLGRETYNEDVSVLRVLKYTLAIFAIAGILLHLYLNSHCIGAPLATKAPDILALLDVIKDNSPKDYEMICKYSKDIDYVGDATPESHGERIIISNAYLGYSENGDKTEKDDKLLAGYVIHEACHNMMYQVMGGYGKNKENDVERPCERMRYMFMYRAGYYKNYTEMINALSTEEYGKKNPASATKISSILRQTEEDKTYKYGSLGRYCEKTKLKTEKTSENPGRYALTFQNTGETTINCGTIELLINGVENPLDCYELLPGQAYQTGKDIKLKNEDTYTARITGC
jgi:hypothetical protein